MPSRTPGPGWTPRGPVRDPGPSRRETYAEAAYRAAGAAVAPRTTGDEIVEVSVRVLAGGGRLAVARRTAGGCTTGIEAQVA